MTQALKTYPLPEPLLWRKEPGTCRVNLEAYSGDFQVMVEQLLEERPDHGKGFPWTDASVVVEPYADFVAWAEPMPRDERGTYDAVLALVERKILPAGHMKTYDEPVTWGAIRALGFDSQRVADLGFAMYVAQLAVAMTVGDVPPLIRLNGQPADGRHRTLAAKLLGLAHAPILLL